MSEIPPDFHDRAVIMPEAVRVFVESALVAGDMALPFHYPKTDEWHGWQNGFRRHGITGESLVATAPGEWQPGWYVVALNGFDDPFFIDLEEAEQGFPVRYAPHGAGRWEPEQVAPNLETFSAILMRLHEMIDDDVAAQRYLEAEVNLSTDLWREVWEQRGSWALASVEPETPRNPEDWRWGTLSLTEIGPQKVKVLHFLKQTLDLTLGEAMALAGNLPITVEQGFCIHLRRTVSALEELGATAEFIPDDNPPAPQGKSLI